jgi:hypothetical protein
MRRKDWKSKPKQSIQSINQSISKERRSNKPRTTGSNQNPEKKPIIDGSRNQEQARSYQNSEAAIRIQKQHSTNQRAGSEKFKRAGARRKEEREENFT